MTLEDRPRSLTDDLRTRSDVELAELFRERPDLVRSQPSDFGQLASFAASDRSVALAMDRLDRLEMQVAEVISAGPGRTTREEVAAAFGSVMDWIGLQSAILAAVDRLWIMALVWGTFDEFSPVGAMRKQIGTYPCRLAASVVSAHRPLLRKYAQEPSTLDATLSDAPPEALAALRKLSFDGPAGYVENADRPVSIESARSPVEWLLARDLVIPTGPTTLIVPREVALHLRGGVMIQDPAYPPPDAGAPGVHDATLVDRTAGMHALDTIEAVREMLDMWSADPPAVLRKGGLSMRDLSAVARALDVEEATAALWAEVANAAGLLIDDREAEPHWMPSTDYDLWLSTPPNEQWALLIRAWLRMTSEPGLVETRDDSGQRQNALSPTVVVREAAVVRRAMADVLAGLQAGVPATAEGLRAGVRHRRPRMADDLIDFVTDSSARQAEVLGLTGLGAMSTAGRDILAGHTPDPLMPTPVEDIVIQGDLTAVAPGPLRRDLAREMSLMADLESKGAAKVYRFTSESVRRALDAGRDAAALLGFLGSISRTEIPQPLQYLIEDVARRHGSIRVGAAASYVRSDDVAALTAALSDRRAAGLGLRRIAPTVLISSARVSSLLTALRAIGLAPVAESRDGGVLIHRSPIHRAAPPPDVVAVVEESTLGGAEFESLLSRILRRLRSGRTATARSTAVVSSVISEAIEMGVTLRITHVDTRGVLVTGTVTPQRIISGKVIGVEERTGTRRQFALERITEAVIAES